MQQQLIIHADDMGLSPSINQATAAALTAGLVTSASIMAPCPGVSEAVSYARDHPDFDFGVHLTLTSEWQYYRWGPILPVKEVPSLVDSEGYFWPTAAAFADRARPREVECELHAQIQRITSEGVMPSHLDSHMFALHQTPAIREVFATVARHHALPFSGPPYRRHPSSGGQSPAGDEGTSPVILTIAEATDPLEWENEYVRLLQSLPSDLSQLVVHLGFDDAESRAMTMGHKYWNSAWRQRDLLAIQGHGFRAAVEALGIRLINWRDINFW